MIDKKEVQKSLLKNKTIAFFDRFDDGKLFYNVWFQGFDFQFPIKTVEDFDCSATAGDNTYSITAIVNGLCKECPDVRGAAFTKEMRGSELFRWIARAIDNNDFIQISQ